MTQTPNLQDTYTHEENSHMMNDFYMLVHDMKSPINQLQSLLKLAKGSKDIVEMHQIIEMALLTSIKMKTKADQILSNTESGIMESKLIDFRALLENIKSTLSFVDGFEGTKFIFNIQNNVLCQGSQIKLQSILQNLIENAIKYRKYNDDYNFVIVTISHHERNVCIKIADNGKGIKKEYQHRIFEKRFQSDGEVEGYGFGLYLVKQNINSIGGHIEVASNEGSGTIFTISLPQQCNMGVSESGD